jgi:glycosyltransferase involved in cell wall biosynthesis
VSEPIVTLIVASLDGERYLHQALESAFAQDMDSFEVVFVDDGSTDATASIARAFPVRYIHQENAGLPSARNAGLAVARGAFVAFLDDDDVLPPDKLRIQSDYLRAHPETGCVLGRQEWIIEAGVEPPNLQRDPIFGDLGGIAMGTAMIRRSILEELHGFDASYRYAEDRDLFVRLREHDVGIEVLPDIVLRRRVHGSNMILSPPESHPLLRSLKEKLDRDRTAASREEGL